VCVVSSIRKLTIQLVQCQTASRKLEESWLGACSYMRTRAEDFMRAVVQQVLAVQFSSARSS
jgi:hypothetical protein